MPFNRAARRFKFISWRYSGIALAGPARFLLLSRQPRHRAAIAAIPLATDYTPVRFAYSAYYDLRHSGQPGAGARGVGPGIAGSLGFGSGGGRAAGIDVWAQVSGRLGRRAGPPGLAGAGHRRASAAGTGHRWPAGPGRSGGRRAGRAGRAGRGHAGLAPGRARAVPLSGPFFFFFHICSGHFHLFSHTTIFACLLQPAAIPANCAPHQ